MNTAKRANIKSKTNPKMEILNTISDIGKHQWNTLVHAQTPEASYEWYKAVEESKMKDLYYVTLWEKGDLVAACCCFTYLGEEIFLKIPFLACWSPLSSILGFFSPSTEHISRLLQGLHTIQDKLHLRGTLIANFEQEDYQRHNLYMKEYNPLSLASTTYLDLPYADFDEYLNSLPSSHRRSIRKTLNRAEKRWQIKHVLTNNLSQWKHVAHRLQGLTCAEHNDFTNYLSKKFYESLQKTMKDKVELSIFLKDSIPLASGLCLNNETVAVHKYAGVDPEYRQYQAYFLLYYEGIRKAIERNQSRICFGTTTYQFKKKIGCEVAPLYSFGKMANPLLNVMLNMYLRVFRPLPQESPKKL
ncbi:MAG: GNAT family N-acetyltransferase [Candidatus Methanofastidiosia archaeon]